MTAAGGRSLMSNEGERMSKRMSKTMYKTMFAAVLAAGLMAAPLPMLTPSASAQAQPATSETKTAKPKKPPSAGQLAARERQKKCGAEWLSLIHISEPTRRT